MADLDDFFAKKDRKKAKGKKFTTTEEIAKKLEETGKKVTKPKDKPQNAESTDDNQQIEEEDEWKVFEEEKKDYSGLKIGNLAVTEVVDDSLDDKNDNDNASDGDSGESSGKVSGPWKKADAPPPPAPPQEPEPQPQTQQTTAKSYKIPQMRNAPPSFDRERPIGRPRGRNIAPDINSEEYFPTLNSKQPNNDLAGAWGKKQREEGTFEEVRNRGGSRAYNVTETQTQAPKLSLGNKYDALPQDQS